MQLFLPLEPFCIVKDGNQLAVSIANRHYSRQWRGNTNQSRICGNGKRMILVHPLGLWVFAWSFQQYRNDKQDGVNCVIFRNESNIKSSEIILLCEEQWIKKHGFMRMFTYVNPTMIQSKKPGYCFQKAGWKRTKIVSTRGLILLEKYPNEKKESY
jgi:hypothetical protein